MTSEQSLFFHEHGYLLLKKAICPKQLQPVRDHVLGELKRLNIWSSGKLTSAAYKKLPPFQQTLKVSSLIRQDHLHDKLLPEPLMHTMSLLAGEDLVLAHQQLLVSLPKQGSWTLAGLNWHSDIASRDPKRIPGVQAFILIDEVRSQGGGTLALAGSQRFESRDNQRARACQLLRDGSNVSVLGPNVSIIEMTGQAGDVYLMDMRVLHTPSINASGHVRMMAAVRCLQREARS